MTSRVVGRGLTHPSGRCLVCDRRACSIFLQSPEAALAAPSTIPRAPQRAKKQFCGRSPVLTPRAMIIQGLLCNTRGLARRRTLGSTILKTSLRRGARRDDLLLHRNTKGLTSLENSKHRTFFAQLARCWSESGDLAAAYAGSWSSDACRVHIDALLSRESATCFDSGRPSDSTDAPMIVHLHGRATVNIAMFPTRRSQCLTFDSRPRS
jgi:hypothetical protein